MGDEQIGEGEVLGVGVEAAERQKDGRVLKFPTPNK